MTWIDVNITAIGQRRSGGWIAKLVGRLLTDAEYAKFAAWRPTPHAQVGGMLAPVCLEPQGRLGPRLIGELSRLAQVYARRQALGTPFAEATLLAAILGRWENV